MNTDRPYVIRIMVDTGSPTGPRTILKSGSDGRGLIFPRDDFADLRDRDELKNAGVYILWGEDPGETESTTLPIVYVGESEARGLQESSGGPGARIYDHDRKKEFWTQAAVFSSENLNKAHTRYLEARLIQLASEIKQCKLDNGTNPTPNADPFIRAEADNFLHDMLQCLPLIGIYFFEIAQAPHERRATSTVNAHDGSDEARLLSLIDDAKGVNARGYSGAEFVVLAGSKASRTETPSLATYKAAAKAQRAGLLELGVLVDNGVAYEFSQNYAFNSASRAACVVLGMSANGLEWWKDRNGRTLKELRDAV